MLLLGNTHQKSSRTAQLLQFSTSLLVLMLKNIDKNFIKAHSFQSRLNAFVEENLSRLYWTLKAKGGQQDCQSLKDAVCCLQIILHDLYT